MIKIFVIIAKRREKRKNSSNISGYVSLEFYLWHRGKGKCCFSYSNKTSQGNLSLSRWDYEKKKCKGNIENMMRNSFFSERINSAVDKNNFISIHTREIASQSTCKEKERRWGKKPLEMKQRDNSLVSIQIFFSTLPRSLFSDRERQSSETIGNHRKKDKTIIGNKEFFFYRHLIATWYFSLNQMWKKSINTMTHKWTEKHSTNISRYIDNLFVFLICPWWNKNGDRVKKISRL